MSMHNLARNLKFWKLKERRPMTDRRQSRQLHHLLSVRKLLFENKLLDNLKDENSRLRGWISKKACAHSGVPLDKSHAERKTFSLKKITSEVKYLKRSRPITMKAAYHLLCGKKVTFSGSKAAAKVIVTEVGPFLSSLASALKFVDIFRQLHFWNKCINWEIYHIFCI